MYLDVSKQWSQGLEQEAGGRGRGREGDSCREAGDLVGQEEDEM